MTTDAAPTLAGWSVLALSPSDLDEREDLAEVLASLRIPTAVLHTRIGAEGTIAYIPVAEDGGPLAVVRTFGADVVWERVTTSQLAEAIARPDVLLGDEPLTAPVVADGPHVESRIDQVVWTSREGDDVLALLAHRFATPLTAIELDAGFGRLLSAAHLEDRVFFEGVWATTDGIALWRAGGEVGVGFPAKGDATIVWRAPALFVDPSLPDQRLEDGTRIADALDALTRSETDTTPWVERFELDDDAASRLRALIRRDPGPEIIPEFCRLLALPPAVLEAFSSPDGVAGMPGAAVISPKTARALFTDSLRHELDRAQPPTAFRRRHPRAWLAISIVAITTLTALCIAGVDSGRPTAFLPGIAAAVWAASLAIERWAGRSAHRRGDEPSVDEHGE